MTQNDIVQKLWNLCDVLRDDGINYSDYVTELVLLLFIKMEQENADNGVLQAHKLPEFARWKTLLGLSGLNLLHHYRSALLQLSQSTDPLIAAIYADAQTRLKEARHLEQLIKSLEGIDWFSAAKDGLGDLYEGLLEKNASETKSGAGQYFTPRPLIDSIVHLMQPQPGETIQDPAAGTAGFLIAADRYMREHTDDYFDLNERERAFQRNRAFLGMELVSGTRRLALMNCLLHGMEGDDAGVVHLGNTLGGAGAEIRRDLMDKCRLHTILRLPTGIFYAQGVKTNVLFFHKIGQAATGSTDEVWVYDMRANAPKFGKRTPLTRAHFAEFEAVFGEDCNGFSPRTDQGEAGRWRRFSREEVRARGDSLDISWLKDDNAEDAADLPEPAVLAREAMDELNGALEELEAILAELGEESKE